MNRKNALTGALVADAASMGLHWLYDQEQIKRVESTGSLLFRQADANVYENMRGAYVHAARRAGELSHYGESARIVSELLQREDYSVPGHRKIFMDTFGPCGSYHGYADRPTKHLIGRMLIEGDELPDSSGMEDNQMPSLCVVPGLFSANAPESQLVEAVKMISINTTVLASAKAVYSVLSQLQSGEALKTALTNAANTVEGELGEQLRNALDIKTYKPLESAQEMGLACYVEHAMPLSWYLLNHATDFKSVVLDNIRCGGDTCGRTMALGSIAGMAFGVPDHMRQKAIFA